MSSREQSGTARRPCYGNLFPDLSRVAFNTPCAGRAFARSSPRSSPSS